MQTKGELRSFVKKQRAALSSEEKTACDNKIFNNLIKSGLIDNAQLVLAYISTDIEVSTKKIISYCIEHKIKVAVPRCKKNRQMDFYYYDENSELERSKFGILEPIPSKNTLVTSFENALTIVPALGFDRYNYRLGYGGGYYDVFLAENPMMKTVGICYRSNIFDRLPRNRFDKRADIVITEENDG